MAENNYNFGAENSDPAFSESSIANLEVIAKITEDKIAAVRIDTAESDSAPESESNPETESNSDDPFNLIASDGVTFRVSEKVVRQSLVFSEMLGMFSTIDFVETSNSANYKSHVWKPLY